MAKDEKEMGDRWRKQIKLQLLQLLDTINDIKKAQDKVQKRYEGAAKRLEKETRDKVYALFLNAFSSALDPHSQYMSVDDLEDFRIQTRLSLEGIGAVLRTEDGFTVVQSLVPGVLQRKQGPFKWKTKLSLSPKRKVIPSILSIWT